MANGGTQSRKYRLQGAGLDLALPYLMLAPGLLIVLGVLVYPLWDGLRASTKVYRYGSVVADVGMQNYIKLWSDPQFLNSLWVTVEFVALSVTTEVAGSGVRRLLAVATAPGLALVLCTAAVAGRLFFGSLSPFPFAVLLGVGIVAMLYLVTEELLVEAHEVEETHWSVAAFFLGFLLFLVIEMLVES